MTQRDKKERVIPVVEAKKIVLEWIGRNYNPAQITVKDFPKAPGGTLVIDQSGSQTLVCWDYLNERIMYGEPLKRKKHSYIYR
jgi:hypothetical protein